MQETRSKNASRNMKFGLINKTVSLALPFISRTLILYLLGTEYLGIGTLFSSILSFLSLVELGIGSAIVFSMYEPIAIGDNERVSALLRYYRRLYRLIGGVMLIIGTALLPAVPYLIKKDAPEGINVYILFYIYLVNSVISYFFAGYRHSLLTAHQRNDITSKITMVVSITVQALQIAALYATRNFYVYALVPLTGTIATNIVNYVITKKKYPEIVCKGEVDSSTKKSIRKRLGGLFGTKLNSIVVHQADIMVISSFIGLTMTAQYGNYYYIMNAVSGLLAVLFSSMTAGIGNKLVLDDMEQNYELFKKISFVNFWLVGWCSVCFLCLFEPFVTIWVGKKLTLGIVFVICMVMYFYIYEIQKTVLTFKDAAGLWHKDMLRPYVSMIVNVVSNIILVNFIGVYGIVLSTVLAFLISLPWANYILFKNLFKINAMENIKSILKSFCLTIFAGALNYAAVFKLPGGVLGLLLRSVICLILPNAVFLAAYRKKPEFLFFKSTLISTVNKVIHK